MANQRTLCVWVFFVFVGLSSVANAAGTLSSLQTTPASIWWVPLISALIGAATAIVTPLLKDLLIQSWNERRTKFDTQREIFRNYAAPLTAASEKLIWRFSEIFIENRHQFLKIATMPRVFNDYKRKSTLYRVASLLGWIRAIHLELSALPKGASGFLTPISAAIGKFQSALADGPYVEMQRLEQLCLVWRLSTGSMAEERRRNLAGRVEVKLYELAGDRLKHDSEHLKNMAEQEKEALCRSLANFLCEELGRAKLGDGIVRETLNQAIAAMSYREALIYRDWQDAIGDAMLEKDENSVRKFKIIGYEKFEGVLEGNSLWMEVFRGSINDIDFESIDPNDFRAKQLRDLSAAVAGMLVSLSETDESDLVSEPALEQARRLAALNTTS